MASDMPERIWVTRVPKFQTARDQGVTVTATSECLIVAPAGKDTEYVLATTHQRTLEALEFDMERLAKERDETLREMRRYLPIIEAAERDAAVWNRITTGTGIATANGYRAALARIKETT